MVTGKERIAMALAHEEGDRVPIDFGGTLSSNIHVDAYAPLLAHLGREEIPLVIDLMQFVVRPSVPMLDLMGSDTVILPRFQPRFGIGIDKFRMWKTFAGTKCLVPDGFNPAVDPEGNLIIRDNSGNILARMPRDGRYFDFSHTPHAHLLENEDPHENDFEKLFPLIDEQEVLFLKNNLAERKKENRAVIGLFGGSILETSQRNLGYEACMEALLLQPDFMAEYFRQMTEAHLKNLEIYLDAIGEEIDVIQMSDDLGSQESLLLSPRVYRELILPCHARIYGYVHKRFPNLCVLLHSCGAISPLLDDLVEAGVNAINPVQISARDMDPLQLKKRYGKHLVFWGGGCDLQHLGGKTVTEIRAELRELIDLFKPSGGFVFTPVHNIQAGVSPEQILAIFRSAKDYGVYKSAGQLV